MADPSEQPSRDPGGTTNVDVSTRWIEWFSALLLAIGAVGAAWTGYETARWSGVQATEFSNANSARQEAARAGAAGGQLVQIDIASFFQVVNAVASEDDQFANFYADRLRPEFEPVFQEWVALDAGNNTDAPLSPFELPSYRVAELEQAQELNREAERATELARAANRTGNDYTVSLVLLAAAIFFAGISTKFTGTRSRVMSLGLGWVLFIGVAIWVGTLPKSIAI